MSVRARVLVGGLAVAGLVVLWVAHDDWPGWANLLLALAIAGWLFSALARPPGDRSRFAICPGACDVVLDDIGLKSYHVGKVIEDCQVEVDWHTWRQSLPWTFLAGIDDPSAARIAETLAELGATVRVVASPDPGPAGPETPG